MEETLNKAAKEAAAFQRIWLETMSKMMQVASTVSPSSPPPEIMRQLRTGIFQALSGSWDEFMRSPQFLEGMRQWMENAITFRKLSNDFMARVRTELQAPSRRDIDTVMLTVRHMEQRLLNRLDELSAEVAALGEQTGGRKLSQKAAASPGRKRRRLSEQRIPDNGKEDIP